MTTVTRLQILLKELQSRQDKKVLQTWQEIFEVSTIFEIYEHLFNVSKEIDLLEQELTKNELIDNPDYKNIVNSFNGIVNHIHMTQTIKQISYMNPENIMKLNISLGTLITMNDKSHLKFKFENEVDEEKFNNFKNSINDTIEEIENSDMPDEDKKIFLSIFYDFNKAISLYRINGLDAFWDVIQNNICKIKMIGEFDDKENKYDNLKSITLKSLNEIWFWIQIYQKTDASLRLGKKAYGYLKDNVLKLTENIDDEIDIS